MFVAGVPLISKGLLRQAREQAARNTVAYEAAREGRKFVFLEPSCLSAMREDAASLLRGEEHGRRMLWRMRACCSKSFWNRIGFVCV